MKKRSLLSVEQHLHHNYITSCFRYFSSDVTQIDPSRIRLDHKHSPHMKLHESQQSSSPTYLYRNSLETTNIMKKNMNQQKSDDQGYYGESIDKCVNSKQLFDLLANIANKLGGVGNFDKYLISMSMNKLIKLGDFDACKQLYQWVIQQNKDNNYDQYTVNFATMIMLYVCTQFGNKYDYALSLFYNEIIPNHDKYKIYTQHLNKCYLYIINSSMINNQYISGKILIDKYLNDIAIDQKKILTATISGIIKFYLHFDKMDDALSIFNKYQLNRDIYTFVILINYFSKIDDELNVIKYFNLFIHSKLIRNFHQYQATKIHHKKKHIVLKLPNEIILPIANYYCKHAMLYNLLILIKNLLSKDDINHNFNKNFSDFDAFFDNTNNENMDIFYEKIFQRLFDPSKPYHHNFGINEYPSPRERVYEYDEDNNDLRHSFVFQSQKPDDKMWLELLKCIGNCTRAHWKIKMRNGN